MTGQLRVQPLDDGVVVWRAPTKWDIVAYAAPSIFCVGVTSVGGVLVAKFGARFLLLTLPGALCLLFFVFAAIRSVQRVRVCARGIALPNGKLVTHSAVCRIEPQRGEDDSRFGVAIHETGHTHVVLLGLAEKDRVAAALALTDGVALQTNTGNTEAFAPV